MLQAGVQTACERISFVDSHTAGEPTRVILSGAPDIGGGSVRDQQNRLREPNSLVWLPMACWLRARPGHRRVCLG